MNTLLIDRRGPRRGMAAVLGLVLLGGCASFSSDGGFTPVQEAARQHLGADAVLPRDDAERDLLDRRVAELLAQPLTAGSAVQIALLNNRGLRSAYQQLGIAEAELVQAGRLPNPGFSFERKSAGGLLDIERQFSISVAHLIAMPLTLKLEQRRFEAVQRIVTQRMLELAADTRKAYFQALAADESMRYMGQVLSAAEASADLARRMAQVGNWSRLRQAREEGFHADAALNLARAAQAQAAARERLIRLLGLWGTQTAFVLAERLPELPDAADDLPDIERTAMAQRLDIRAARIASEEMAANLGLTRVTGFVNVLDVGVIRNSVSNEPSVRGYSIELEVPIFDWGGAKVARAEALYRQSLEQLAEAAVNARSEVRLAYLNYRASYDIARHYREQLVPNARLISDENLLRYNAMQIGVFELLADARAQIAVVNAAIQAQRDFWLARADLDMALLGRASPTAPPSMAMTGAAASAAH